MCGRFTVTATKEDIEQRFSVSFPDSWQPNYNAAPTQLLPIIRDSHPETITMARFGMIPPWAKQINVGYKMINARAETILQKITYKTALKHRRCLVIADGFYEWKKIRNGKQPYRFILKKKQLFAFAGLWNYAMIDGKEILSFSIITTKPNSAVSKVHDRMPVILPKQKEQEWLTCEVTKAVNMLKTFPASKLKAYQVSSNVNSVGNNHQALIEIKAPGEI
jgi:putative SOS response-associated peptidase YedK